MSDKRLTKDKRERWRVDLADDHPEACNPWDIEAALDECDALERERDEARRLVRYAIAPESPGEGRYMLPLVEAVTTWEGDDDEKKS